MKQRYTTPSRGAFVADPEHNGKMVQLFKRKQHPQEDELELFERFLTKDGVFLDIGANIGTITVPVAKIVKEVLAFEPIRENVLLLEENIKVNNPTNVRVFPFAVGGELGNVKLEAQDGNDAGTYSIRGDGDIPLITLDSIESRPTFIKIGVEGYEAEVLKGAQKTIQKYRPVIVFEVNLIETRKRNDWWLSRVSAELSAQGYKLYLPNATGHNQVGSIAWVMFKLAPKAFLTGKLHYSTNFLALPG